MKFSSPVSSLKAFRARRSIKSNEKGINRRVTPAKRNINNSAATIRVAFLVAAILPLAYLRHYVRPLFVAAVVMCFAAALIFSPVNGASRWIHLGSVHFQPVEIARFLLVFYCAAVIADRGNRVHGFRDGFMADLGSFL